MKEINKVLSFFSLVHCRNRPELLNREFYCNNSWLFTAGSSIEQGHTARKSSVSNTASLQPSSQTQRYSGPIEPSTGIRCAKCGATAKRSTKYCTKCGHEMGRRQQQSTKNDSPTYSPEYVRASLERLRSDKARYTVLVQDLLMVDESGSYWSIGVQSSKWYVYENGNWVPDQPTGLVRIVRGGEAISEAERFVEAPIVPDRGPEKALSPIRIPAPTVVQRLTLARTFA